MNKQTLILALAALLLGACATVPAPVVDRAGHKPVSGRGGYLPGDGPGENIPANLDAIPDAVPVNEPLHRYANQPYVALGQSYTPMTVTGQYKQRGIASWYGKKFHGQRTSNGDEYDMYAMTAAHPILPVPSYARVTNVGTGKSVVVRINDRGPFMHDRVIDLSYTAAYKLGVIGNGSSEVEVESLLPGADSHSTTRPIAVQTAPLTPSQPVPVIRSAAAPVAPAAASQAHEAGAGSNAYLQLGVFGTPQAAERFLAEMRAKLGNLGKQLVLFKQNNQTRVHIGPYASQAEARNSRMGLRDKLGFMPVLSVH